MWQRPSTASSASRRPAAPRSSGRRLGSKNTVPPRALTASTPASATSITAGEKSEVPMTWKRSARAGSARAASVSAIRPVALWARLRTKLRPASSR